MRIKVIALMMCSGLALTGCKTMTDRNIDVIKDMAGLSMKMFEGKSEGEILAMGKEAVKTRLKDPSSAQFSNVYIVQYGDGMLVCGDVNAKNSYGGYVGAKPFVAGSYSAWLWQRMNSSYSERSANAGLLDACSNEPYHPRQTQAEEQST